MMKDICETCDKEPGSHSFTYLCKTLRPELCEYIFYTCVGDAKKYNDSDGIIKHYKNFLNKMNPDKWIWVFNCDGFGLKHYTEINTIKKLALLVKTFGRIEAIYIVNSPGLLDVVLNIVQPILDKETFGKIKLVKSKDLLENIYLSEDEKNKLKKLLVKKYN